MVRPSSASWHTPSEPYPAVSMYGDNIVVCPMNSLPSFVSLIAILSICRGLLGMMEMVACPYRDMDQQHGRFSDE
jgi:hypothetical protein